MDARLDVNDSAILQKFVKHLNAAGAVVGSPSTLPTATQNLVLIRASQINGCAVCTDMHTKDAAHAGETAAWANAAKHYDTDQLAALVCLIALINTYNRLNVIARNQGGDYQPGQWG